MTQNSTHSDPSPQNRLILLSRIHRVPSQKVPKTLKNYKISEISRDSFPFFRPKIVVPKARDPARKMRRETLRILVPEIQKMSPYMESFFLDRCGFGRGVSPGLLFWQDFSDPKIGVSASQGPTIL